MQSLLLLLPDFALIAMGVLLRRYFGLADAFWTGVEKLVYFIFFPALLFHALARATIDIAAMGPLFVVGLVTMAAGLLLGLAGRPLMGLDAMAFASRLQCAYRFNTYIGIAVAGKFAGAPGLAMMGALCGAMVPFANMAAVGLLVLFTFWLGTGFRTAVIGLVVYAVLPILQSICSWSRLQTADELDKKLPPCRTCSQL